MNDLVLLGLLLIFGLFTFLFMKGLERLKD
jgi:hypothetical protein